MQAKLREDEVSADYQRAKAVRNQKQNATTNGREDKENKSNRRLTQMYADKLRDLAS
jgi:hypothetical protein